MVTPGAPDHEPIEEASWLKVIASTCRGLKMRRWNHESFIDDDPRAEFLQ